MKNTKSIHKVFYTLFYFAIGSTASAQVYVWEDPDRETNTSVIYTIGKLVDADGASARSAVLGSDGFGAVRYWGDTGTDWLAGTATVNGLRDNDGIMAFENALLPDVRFSVSGTLSSIVGTQLNNYAFSSSAPDNNTALRLLPGSSDDPVSTTLTIDFGSWNGSMFDANTNAVQAAAFTLNSNSSRWNDLIDIGSLTVIFYDDQGQVLSTQGIPDSFPPGATGSSSLFFGYNSTSANIGSVEITQVGTNSQILGLDEFGFSAIPEASTLLYVSLMAGAGLLLRLRQRR